MTQLTTRSASSGAKRSRAEPSHPHRRRRLSCGYVVDDFCVGSDDDEASAESDAKAMAMLRDSIACARHSRLQRAAEYAALERRQRLQRVQRGLPIEEEDNQIESLDEEDEESDVDEYENEDEDADQD